MKAKAASLRRAYIPFAPTVRRAVAAVCDLRFAASPAPEGQVSVSVRASEYPPFFSRGKRAVVVVTSSVSFVLPQAAGLIHSAVPPLPTKLRFAGTPSQQHLFRVRGRKRYNSLDLAGKVVCHGDAVPFGFPRHETDRFLWILPRSEPPKCRV